jgi:transposase
MNFSLDTERAMWEPRGEDWEFAKTSSRQEILDAVRDAGESLSPKEIAEATGKSHDNVRVLVRKMHEDGELRNTEYGEYAPPQAP